VLHLAVESHTQIKLNNSLIRCIVMPRPRREGVISVAFVRPSARPFARLSVAYIANNSRTQRPIACPNLEGRFPTFDVTRIPVQGQKVKDQGHQAH